MDPIFEHSVFDSAREKKKRFITQLEKSEEAFGNLLQTCLKYEGNNVYSIAKQVRSADKKTSVFIECCDCHNKWRDG